MNCRFSFIFFFVGLVHLSFAQTKSEKKVIKEYNLYAAQAAEERSEGDFAQAEALYRKALSTKPDGEEAAYNFGNLYYENEKKNNSALRYIESVETTEDKSIRHKNYHNLGNLFMDKKDYANAVEAYKNALRNNPTDEETRYNLALAKKMKEKEQQENQGQDKNQQDKDKKEDKEDKKDQNKGGEGDQDKKDEQKQDKKEGDDDKENQQPNEDSNKDPKEGDNQKKEQPSKPEPRKGKMSEQQIKNLLQAIENKEKNTQEKLNAKKVKGQKVKTEKDW